ncbi:MAG: hypothetical protein LBQ66_01835 [Planctomycetaceae bacterium]|nr:hypothetical protein [Planctomycetaceae bacterium]
MGNRPAVGYPPYVVVKRLVAYLTLSMRFTIHWDEGKPRPYNDDVIHISYSYS